MATTSSRKFFVGGNWKCVGSTQSITELTSKLKSAAHPDDKIVETVVAPPFVYLHTTQAALASTSIAVSAQNCWYEDKGAFTGEISAAMLKDIGIGWVILGHSERRHTFEETNETLAKKCSASLKHGLSVIFCIGELLEERESNKTEAVITAQIEAVKDHINDWSRIVIAYEPVWAIGTGKVASPQQAQDAHVILRQWLKQHVSNEVAQSTRIIYGGSVKPDNCVELSKKQDIDGFLVGGCSLVAEQFSAIIASANESLKKDSTA